MDSFKRQFVPSSKLPKALLVKWSPEILDEGFVPLPKRLLRCLHKLWSSEDMKELATLLAIIDFRRPDLTQAPSHEFLAFVAGLEVEDLKTQFLKLENKGWLSAAAITSIDPYSLSGFEQKIKWKTEE